MIIASDKLIIQPDDTLNSVIAGRHEAIAVKHSYIRKAVGNATSIAYDATSQKAVNTLLSVDTSGKIVYPLIEYNATMTTCSPVSFRYLEKVYGNSCVNHSINKDCLASAMFSLVNKLVYVSKRHVSRKSIAKVLFDKQTVWNVDLYSGIMETVTVRFENWGVNCDDLVKYSDSLFQKGWIILGFDIVTTYKQYNHYSHDLDVFNICTIKLMQFDQRLKSENIADLTAYILGGKAQVCEG